MINKNSLKVISITLPLLFSFKANSKYLTNFELKELENIRIEEGEEVSKELLFFLSLEENEKIQYVKHHNETLSTPIQVIKGQVEMQKQAYKDGGNMAREAGNNLKQGYAADAKAVLDRYGNKNGRSQFDMNENYYNEEDLDY